MIDTMTKKNYYSSSKLDVRSVVFHLVDNNLDRYDFESSIRSLSDKIELLGYSADLGQSKVHLIIRGYDSTSNTAFRLLKKNLSKHGFRGKIKLVGSTPLQLYLKGQNILTSLATELFVKTGEKSNMVVGVLLEHGPCSVAETVDALYRLEVPNPQALIEEAVVKGLVVSSSNGLEPSDFAKSLLNKIKSDDAETDEKEYKIKRIKGFVVYTDGHITELEPSTALESLIRSGVDLNTSFKVVNKLQRVLGFLEEPFIKAEELSEFITRELTQLDRTGRLTMKYSRFMTGAYLVLNDKPLKRSQLKKYVEKALGKLGLVATSGHIDEISGDVIESLRRLCWGAEGITFETDKELLMKMVGTRLNNAPGVSLIMKAGKRSAVQKLRREAKSLAEQGLSVAKEREGKGLPVRLGIERLMSAGEKLFQSLLIESDLLPTGYIISDASLVASGAGRWKKLDKTIVNYCRRMASTATSENTSWETVEELLKVTLRLSNFLQ
jgi:hypothetical protein